MSFIVVVVMHCTARNTQLASHRIAYPTSLRSFPYSHFCIIKHRKTHTHTHTNTLYQRAHEM